MTMDVLGIEVTGLEQVQAATTAVDALTVALDRANAALEQLRGVRAHVLSTEPTDRSTITITVDAASGAIASQIEEALRAAIAAGPR